MTYEKIIYCMPLNNLENEKNKTIKSQNYNIKEYLNQK